MRERGSRAVIDLPSKHVTFGRRRQRANSEPSTTLPFLLRTTFHLHAVACWPVRVLALPYYYHYRFRTLHQWQGERTALATTNLSVSLITRQRTAPVACLKERSVHLSPSSSARGPVTRPYVESTPPKLSVPFACKWTRHKVITGAPSR